MIHPCLQNELHWQSYRTVEPDTAAQGPIDVPDHDPFSREVLKCVVTANVVIIGADALPCLLPDNVTVIGIYLYYRTSLQLAKLRGIMLPQGICERISAMILTEHYRYLFFSRVPVGLAA